jgi:hypothetical protein
MLRLTRREFKALGPLTLAGDQKVRKPGWRGKKGHAKTQVESEFELHLKADWPQLTILYETVKLKIDDTCWYLPDFFIPELLTFFEVKGPQIWEDSKIKFKAARVLHGWACFQMHQKKNGVWTRLY